jgi:hypothetical protein
MDLRAADRGGGEIDDHLDRPIVVDAVVADEDIVAGHHANGARMLDGDVALRRLARECDDRREELRLVGRIDPIVSPAIEERPPRPSGGRAPAPPLGRARGVDDIGRDLHG